MSTVEKTYWADGEVPTAGDLNGPYTALSIASNAVQDDNTASGWITEAHIAGAEVCNKLYQYSNPTYVTQSYNANTFTTISDGTTDAILTLGFDAGLNEVLRFSVGGFVNDLEIVDTYDPTPAGPPRGGSGLAGTGNLGRFNYYIFRLIVTYNDGGSDQALEIGRWGYSFNTCGYGSYVDQHPAPADTPEIQNQAFAFSAAHRNEVEGRTFVEAKLQIQVFFNQNVVKVSRHNIICHRARG